MEIFREPTSEEKKDFKLILSNEEDIFEKFRKKVQETEKQYFSDNKPFCSRCARIEFKESVSKKIKGFEETIGYENDISKFKISMPELAPYGEADRFDFIKESKAMEPVPAGTGTLKRQIQIGVHKDYRCKVRNCGISLFVSNGINEI